MEGWVKIHRKIQSSDIWGGKEKFCKRAAWVDLILSVNHKKNTFLLGNQPITVNRGEMITSIRGLSKRWRWSRTKVNDFLFLLEKLQMILAQKKDHHYTRIKVLQYEDYQNPSQNEKATKEPQKSHKRATKKPQKSLNKNVKNVKNDKNVKKKDLYTEESKAYRCAVYLRNKILENNPRAKVPGERSLERWANAADLLNRLGPVGASEKESKGYSWREIADIINWCQTDEFWSTNILSMPKLREQVTQLENKMRKTTKKKQISEDKKDTSLHDQFAVWAGEEGE